jgi:Lrp/AsnC family transcriptional regulator, leucine-responsive regulatory protein
MMQVQQLKLDAIDFKILGHLQRNARVSNAALATLVGLSPAPCLRRVRALERAGVIREYVTLLDSRALRMGVTVFTAIRLNLQVEDQREIIETEVKRWPEVLECHLMTGDADFLLRVAVPDVSAYERFLRDRLTRLACVASIRSSFALKEIKYTTALPLAEDNYFLPTPKLPGSAKQKAARQLTAAEQRPSVKSKGRRP